MCFEATAGYIGRDFILSFETTDQTASVNGTVVETAILSLAYLAYLYKNSPEYIKLCFFFCSLFHNLPTSFSADYKPPSPLTVTVDVLFSKGDAACFTVELTDDNLFENPTENFLVTLNSKDSAVDTTTSNTTTDTAVITVLDDEGRIQAVCEFL